MSDSTMAFLRLVHQARSQIEEISPKELFRTKPLPLVIDVREADEYSQGHIAGAKHLSRGVLEQNVSEMVLNFSTPIVVYCDQGKRAALVAENLLKMGYLKVRSLQGGLQNWLESGGVLEISNRVRNRNRE